jgi:hypothetical protein
MDHLSRNEGNNDGARGGTIWFGGTPVAPGSLAALGAEAACGA